MTLPSEAPAHPPPPFPTPSNKKRTFPKSPKKKMIKLVDNHSNKVLCKRKWISILSLYGYPKTRVHLN